MPADTNPNGDIFGGWLLAQMDIAGGIAARSHSGGRTVTIAVESMVFKKPVQVGMSCPVTPISKRSAGRRRPP
ncbi:MAG: acyl-CoA thioesterase [Alphaproteobacteria bacterium]